MNEAVIVEIGRILTWGLLAAVALMALSHASQNFGWSRLNFPLLLGTLFTSNRAHAVVLGFVLYMLLGWLIAFFYYMLMAYIGGGGVLVGIGLGLLHGLFILVVLLPLLPYLHPRMATEYDGPTEQRRLEPPGFLALHYGSRTPIVLLAIYAAYGGILGFGFR